MEKSLDRLLEQIFGGFDLQLNLIGGLLLLVIGILVLVFSKKQSSKGKGTVGWICMGVGGLGVVSSVIQLLFG